MELEIISKNTVDNGEKIQGKAFNSDHYLNVIVWFDDFLL